MRIDFMRQNILRQYIYICVVWFLVLSCHSERVLHSVTPTELREVGRLELIEYQSEEIFVISDNLKSISNVSSLEEVGDYINNLLQVGDRIGVYSFDFYTTAYIDLQSLGEEDIVCDPKAKSIYLTLPPIEVEPIGRGGEIRLLHERVTGTQKHIHSNERQNMQRQAVGLAKKNLLPGTPKYQEIVTKAQNKARAYFTAMLVGRGYEVVTIRFSES